MRVSAAPERLNQLNPVSRRVDIWSLGCVLSQAATWIVLGIGGIAQYRQVRQAAIEERRKALEERQSRDASFCHPFLTHISREQRRVDLFHDGKNVLDAVTQWHNLLRVWARRSDNITPEILKVIDDMMLIGDPEKRKEAKDVCIALEKAMKSYTPVKLPDRTSSVVTTLLEIDLALPEDPTSRSTGQSPEEIKKSRDDGPLSITPENMKVSKRSEVASTEHSKASKITVSPDAEDFFAGASSKHGRQLSMPVIKGSKIQAPAPPNPLKRRPQNVIQAYYKDRKFPFNGKDPELGAFFKDRNRDLVSFGPLSCLPDADCLGLPCG